jgi:trehalose 6-phosphate synthase/phosphatase
MSMQNCDFGWMELTEPVMKIYTELTDGSSIETKESALVWRHQDADPGFGSSQAKEMLDHLESVLANEPVSVRSGQYIVEVKPQVCLPSPPLPPHVLILSVISCKRSTNQ